MENQLNGKIALVTGGSRGLGKNEALAIAAQGGDLVITYRSKEAEAKETVKAIEALGRKAVALPLDVADISSFDSFAEKLSEALQSTWQRDRIDALVNNAGIDRWGMIEQISEEDVNALIDVHFKGTFFLTQKLLPLLADGGSVVNTSTGLARFSIPGYAAYAAMKSAVETFTRYLAKELGQRGIRANVVAPGAIETDFTAPAFEANPQMKEIIAGNTALGRVGQPDDIGRVVAFLVSDASRWVNAQRIEASGGMFL